MPNPEQQPQILTEAEKIIRRSKMKVQAHRFGFELLVALASGHGINKYQLEILDEENNGSQQ